MKRISIEMPEVRKCTVTACAYNTAESCHAKAITVGHEAHPDCDTFMMSGTHVQDTSVKAGVGACRAVDCKFNKDFECTADGIQVGAMGQDARCQTYST